MLEELLQSVSIPRSVEGVYLALIKLLDSAETIAHSAEHRGEDGEEHPILPQELTLRITHLKQDLIVDFGRANKLHTVDAIEKSFAEDEANDAPEG